MKKNLMSVLILALVLVNLILTGILTITILPQTKKSNELVNKVCSAIDLAAVPPVARTSSMMAILNIPSSALPAAMSDLRK